MNLRTWLHGRLFVGAAALVGCGDTVAGSARDAAPDAAPDAVTDAPRDLPDADSSDVARLDATTRDDVAMSDAVAHDAAPTTLGPLASRCTAQFERTDAFCAGPSCAVTAFASARCPSGGAGLSVAAVAGGARVAFTDNDGSLRPTLFTFELAPPRVGAEEVPTRGWPAHVFSATRGGHYVMGLSADSTTLEKVALFERDAAGWRRTVIDGSPLGPSAPTPGLHHADGRESFAYARFGESDPGDLAVATRALDGRWSVASLPVVPFGRYALATANGDGSGDTAVVHWVSNAPLPGNRTLVLRQGGATRPIHVQQAGNTEDHNIVHAVVRAGGASPVVSLRLDDGIHLFVPEGEGFRDVLVPDSARVDRRTCPGEGGPCGGPVRTCTARGTYLAADDHALVRTDDGRVWLLHAQVALDRDYELRATMMKGSSCVQTTTVTADRSQHRVVLRELVGGATIERLRLAGAAILPTVTLAADAHGAVIHLVQSGEGQAGSADAQLRYVALDTARLPR